MKPIFIASALILISTAAHATDSSHRPAAGMNALTGKAAEFSAQTKQERQRPRVRVQRVQPPAWDYPRPGNYSWPGPGAVRECVDWYATEYRPSGTVITPQMRCRWVRG